jgi:hypothetical protein
MGHLYKLFGIKGLRICYVKCNIHPLFRNVLQQKKQMLRIFDSSFAPSLAE